MKALLFTPIPSPYLAPVYKRLAEMDPPVNVVPVFYRDNSHRKAWGEINWSGHWLKGSLFRKLREINRIFALEKPDCVILSQYIGTVPWFAKYKALTTKRPFFFFFLDPFKPGSAIRTAIREFVFKAAVHRASGIGIMGKSNHIRCARLFKGPIIDTPYAFAPEDLLSIDDRHRPKDKTVFLYSGPLTAHRNPLGVLRVFAELRREYGERVELILSGKGPQEKACLELIQEQNLTPAVRWMNDFMDWRDLRTIYRQAHVLLSLGQHSTWNLTICEAMAAGLGVIATHTTEAANTLILDNWNGFLLHPGSETQAHQAARKYIENPDLLQTHIERSKSIIGNQTPEAVTKTIHVQLANSVHEKRYT